MGTVYNRYQTDAALHPSVNLIWTQALSGFAVWDGTVTATGNVNALITDISPTTTNAGVTHYTTGTLTNSAINLKSSAGNLYGVNAVSNNSTQSFIKLYNMPSANVATGLSLPFKVVSIPANSSTTIPVNGVSQGYFTGLSMLATSVLGNLTSQNAPTNAVYVDLQYS
jgi:hypothetical protein